MPTSVSAQNKDKDKPTFPLENFYVDRKSNTMRKLLRNVRLGVSVGYGRTYFNHDLNGFGIHQKPGRSPIIFPADVSNSSRYSNWINIVQPDTITIAPESFLISSDSARLGFKGKALNIPLKATLHYEFLKRYRIGGGYSYEFMSLGTFQSKTYRDEINEFKPSDPNGFMRKVFGMAGASFYRYHEYLLTGDLQIGSYKMKRNFDMSLIEKGVYVNIGVTGEREFSEYLRAFIRPSYEIKSYTLDVGGSGQTIRHGMNAFQLDIGLSYTLPELPRCFHSRCQAQINHAHGNKEYRSRMHPIFKKQNPAYGENHPTLIKYKGKNKKKLNPY